MAVYLVIHSPRPDAEREIRQPTRLRDLVDALSTAGTSPQWLKAWSPDLHDDRIFTLWEARSGDEIRSVLARFGFLDDMEATPLQVREWGPDDVRAAE